MFHQGALSTAPLKVFGKHLGVKKNIWVLQKNILVDSQRQPSAYCPEWVVKKNCHGHHTWLVGAAVTSPFPSTMCHQKGCKSYLSNNTFFFFVYFSKEFSAIEAQQADVQISTSFWAPHSQCDQFREVYSGQYLTLDSWFKAPIVCSSRQSNLDPLSPIAAETCLHAPHGAPSLVFCKRSQLWAHQNTSANQSNARPARITRTGPKCQSNTYNTPQHQQRWSSQKLKMLNCVAQNLPGNILLTGSDVLRRLPRTKWHRLFVIALRKGRCWQWWRPIIWWLNEQNKKKWLRPTRCSIKHGQNICSWSVPMQPASWTLLLWLFLMLTISKGKALEGSIKCSAR